MTIASEAGAVATARAGRTYGDGCAAAHALDLVGERWALLIVRELLFGPKRFTDLEAGLRNIRPNVLSQRLRELEHSRVLRRRRLGPPAPAWVYELTEWGRGLEPILVGLGSWGRRSPHLPVQTDLSPGSLMFALHCHFDAARAEGLTATYLFTVGDDEFTVLVGLGRMSITHGAPSQEDVAVVIDPETLKALIIDGRRPGEAPQDGRFEMKGDIEAFHRLLDAIV